MYRVIQEHAVTDSQMLTIKPSARCSKLVTAEGNYKSYTMQKNSERMARALQDSKMFAFAMITSNIYKEIELRV